MNKSKIVFAFLAVSALVINTIFVISITRPEKDDININNSNSNITSNLSSTSLNETRTKASTPKREHKFKRNITPTNFTKHPIVNSLDYGYLINTNEKFCGNDFGKDLLLIAFVPISPNSFQQRVEIRSTWAHSRYLTSRGKIVFMVGKSSDPNVNTNLKLESQVYGDLVQTNFTDSYYNLTTKTIMGFRWVSNYCQNAKYTLKVDDDVVVNIPFLISYLDELVKNDTHQYNSIICRYYAKAPVDRDVDSKFFMSEAEFKDEFYHPYCDGPAYIINTELVQRMYAISPYFQLIKFEDVYVGLLAKNLNSTFVDISGSYRFQKWWNDFNSLITDKDIVKRFFIYARDPGHFNFIWNFLISLKIF